LLLNWNIKTLWETGISRRYGKKGTSQPNNIAPGKATGWQHIKQQPIEKAGRHATTVQDCTGSQAKAAEGETNTMTQVSQVS
jgi:hypothetical protein